MSLLSSSLSIAQEDEGETVTEIPSRFFQIQDENGFFWQAAGNGSLTSGETQYLQSGLNWLIDGVSFEPSTATVRPPDLFPENSGVTLTEQRENLILTRELKLDRERGAVRVFDSIKNTGAKEAELDVVLRTTYPFAWQSLHGIDGELLSKEPVLSLGEKDDGLVVHFSAAEGHHDTFLLTGGGGGALRPRLNASTNKRELSMSYRMTIPAGDTQSLLHWISQRAMPDMSEAPGNFSLFYHRDQLVRSGLDTPKQAQVVNFPPSAFPNEITAPGGLKSLIALNMILDPLGVVRKGEDVQFLSATNRVSGTLSSDGDLEIMANHLGKISIPLSKLAAIRGGGGIGRKQIFYLRDGQVRAGRLISGNLFMTVSGGAEASPLDIDQVNLITRRTEGSDGTPVKGTTHFVRLLDQSVFAVIAGDTPLIPLATPWGNTRTGLGDIQELGHIISPYPTHRIHSEEGSIYSAFLSDELISLKVAGDEPVEISTHLISQAWKAGASSLILREFGEAWLDLDEAPPGSDEGGALLSGNQFLKAELSGDQLSVQDAGGTVTVDSSAIRQIRRDLPEKGSLEQHFVIEMRNGETLTGLFERPFLSLSREGRPLEIPIESFIVYRAPTL
ncbi:MAG: hypothetical protein P1U68_03560 [Verrucomicrobiales bacterium]|nr:hypothetical protein [Verrucomicrobiales bacterium]